MSRHCLSLRHVAPALGGALLGCAFSACELPPATAVAVSVKSELIAGIELGTVTYRVFGAKDDPEQSKPVSEFTTPVQTLDKPFIVTRSHSDEFLLSVEGFAPGLNQPVIVYRERVRFEPGKTLALHVYLAKACYKNVCLYGGLTCFGQSYGSTPAGDCAPILDPRELDVVSEPGDESAWQPEHTSSSLIDAGLASGQPFGPFGPALRGDGGLGALNCTSGRTSPIQSCWPGDASTLDASHQPPFFDRK